MADFVVGKLRTGESVFGIDDMMEGGRHRISALKGAPRYFDTKDFMWLYPVDRVECMWADDPKIVKAFKRIEFNLA